MLRDYDVREELFADRVDVIYLGLSPTQVKETPSRLCLFWRKQEGVTRENVEQIFLNILPELTEFRVYTPHGRDEVAIVSTAALPVGVIYDRIASAEDVILVSSRTMWLKEHNNADVKMFFPDLPEPEPPLIGEWGRNYVYRLSRMVNPQRVDRKAEEVPPVLQFHVARQGHDGAANGGDWGWVYYIYTDGQVFSQCIEDNSFYQTGNRLNWHETNYVSEVTFKNATWVVVREVYDGLVYHYDDRWMIFGDPPEDALRPEYRKEVL